MTTATLDARIMARRAKLDQLAGYFGWAAGVRITGSAGSRSEARGRAALNRMAGRYARDMPVGPDDRFFVAYLERWERICTRRMDAEGFAPGPGTKHAASYLWYANGVATAARDAIAIIRTGSIDIRDWNVAGIYDGH